MTDRQTTDATLEHKRSFMEGLYSSHSLPISQSHVHVSVVSRVVVECTVVRTELDEGWRLSATIHLSCLRVDLLDLVASLIDLNLRIC